MLAKFFIELANEIVAKCFVKKCLTDVGACLVADGRHLNSCVGHLGNWFCSMDAGDQVTFNVKIRTDMTIASCIIDNTFVEYFTPCVRNTESPTIPRSAATEKNTASK